MIEAGFDLTELDQFNKDMLELADKTMPNETKKFIRRQGAKLERNLKNAYKTRVGKKTGNLQKGVGRGAPTQYEGDWQIRVWNAAPHAHLIEHGHVMKDHKGNPIRNKFGEEVWVEGKYVTAFTVNDFKRTYPDAVDEFIDLVLEKGLK